MLHDTGGETVSGTLEWFNNPESKVSSHYVVEKDGSIYRCVPDDFRAWHAGESILHGENDVNDFSIGIEIVDNNDKDGYPEEQIQNLTTLCAYLCDTYSIPVNKIVGHEHICIPKGRKVDPGKDFPWFDFLNAVACDVFQRRLDG